MNLYGALSLGSRRTERVLAGDCLLTPNSKLVGGQAGGLANTSRGNVAARLREMESVVSGAE